MLNIFPPPAMKFPTPPHGPSVALVMTRAPPRRGNPKNVFFSFAQDNHGDFLLFSVRYRVRILSRTDFSCGRCLVCTPHPTQRLWKRDFGQNSSKTRISACATVTAMPQIIEDIATVLARRSLLITYLHSISIWAMSDFAPPSRTAVRNR